MVLLPGPPLASGAAGAVGCDGRDGAGQRVAALAAETRGGRGGGGEAAAHQSLKGDTAPHGRERSMATQVHGSEQRKGNCGG